jgi:hypothetical protein
MAKLLLDTQYAHTAGLKGQISQVVKFLAMNRNVVIPPGQLAQIFANRPIMSTGMNKLFEKMVETRYIDEFANILPVSQKGTPKLSLPDLLGWTNITIDLKGVQDAQVLHSYPEISNKILANIASLVRIEPGRTPQTTDINELHSMYVRGMFVRSFAVSDGWLTPILCTFLIQSYCLPIASVIGRMENLNVQEINVVATLFALYMAQMLSRHTDDKARPPLLYRCTFLGTMRELDDVANRVAHISGNGLNIATVCELVAELGPSRLNKFNAHKFYTVCKSLGPNTDEMSTRLAFEYPPYWLSLVLRAADGYRSGAITGFLKQHGLLGRPSGEFVNGLLTCRQMFEAR